MKLRNARIIKILAIVLVGLAVLYAVAWLLAARSLRQARAELEAAGRPMTLEEIELDPVSPAQNAAPLYQAALLLLQSEPFGDGSMHDHLATNTWVAPSDPRSPAAVESELRAALRQEVCIEALKLIEKGATRPHYRFIGKAYNQTNSPFRIDENDDRFRVAHMLSLGRLLNAQARIQMADGDRHGAWRTALTSCRFANSFSQIPVLIGQLLRLALADAATESARNLCAVSLPDPGQMDELQRWLRSYDDSAPIARAIDIERIVIDHRLFRDPAMQDQTLDNIVEESPFFVSLLRRTCYLKPVQMADYAFILRFYHRMARAYESLGSPNDPHSDEIFSRGPFFYLLSYCHVVADNRLRIRRFFANFRITAAGLAVLQYHREHGAFPESLSVLDGLNLTDPLTGQPLAYQVEPDGFRISSSGPQNGSEDAVAWRYRFPQK